MQEEQPIVHALASAHCNEDTTSYQSPSKRKTRLQSQSKQANSSAQTPPSSRYTRSQAVPDWTVQEVMVLLSEIVAIDEVWLKELSSYQRWKMISDSCIAMNVVRSSNQCKRKWETLLDDYKKIMKWEPQSREDSYWFLPEDKRKEYELPVSFQREVFDAMDAVIQVQQYQSDSNNSDPEQLITVPVFEASNMNVDSEIPMLYLPSSVFKGEELDTTSKIPEAEELILKSPEKAIVLAGHATSIAASIGDELIMSSKSLEVEESTLESPEKSLLLTGNYSITASKNPELRGLMKTSKSSEERPEVEVLDTTSKNLEMKPEVEELFATSERPEIEELATTSKNSEERLEAEVPNTTSKSLEERPEVEELIKTSKSHEVEYFITASKRPEVEHLITASKSPVVEGLITTLKSPKNAPVIAVSKEENFITAAQSSEGEELIATSKSSEKASVITVSEQEELIPNSKSSDQARYMKVKLHENAEHVCSILRGELQEAASHCPSPMDSLNPSATETEFARRQADELIKALAELTKSLDDLSDHVRRCGSAGIAPVGFMA